MPIYEFKCTDCEEFFEVIIMNSEDDKTINCPKCKSNAFQRVVSKTNFSMGSPASAGNKEVSAQTRECSSGSCHTYTVPGESRS